MPGVARGLRLGETLLFDFPSIKLRSYSVGGKKDGNWAHL